MVKGSQGQHEHFSVTLRFISEGIYKPNTSKSCSLYEIKANGGVKVAGRQTKLIDQQLSLKAFHLKTENHFVIWQDITSYYEN